MDIVNQKVGINSDSLFIKKRTTTSTIKIDRVKSLYVKEYSYKSKTKRSLLISIVFSLPVALSNPLAGAGAFLAIFIASYAFTKKYELRGDIFNNDEIGVVNTGLHSTNNRDEIDGLVRAYESR